MSFHSSKPKSGASAPSNSLVTIAVGQAIGLDAAGIKLIESHPDVDSINIRIQLGAVQWTVTTGKGEEIPLHRWLRLVGGKLPPPHIPVAVQQPKAGGKGKGGRKSATPKPAKGGDPEEKSSVPPASKQKVSPEVNNLKAQVNSLPSRAALVWEVSDLLTESSGRVPEEEAKAMATLLKGIGLTPDFLKVTGDGRNSIMSRIGELQELSKTVSSKKGVAPFLEQVDIDLKALMSLPKPSMGVCRVFRHKFTEASPVDEGTPRGEIHEEKVPTGGD